MQRMGTLPQQEGTQMQREGTLLKRMGTFLRVIRVFPAHQDWRVTRGDEGLATWARYPLRTISCRSLNFL